MLDPGSALAGSLVRDDKKYWVKTEMNSPVEY
jgi:hypothetical protein